MPRALDTFTVASPPRHELETALYPYKPSLLCANQTPLLNSNMADPAVGLFSRYTCSDVLNDPCSKNYIFPLYFIPVFDLSSLPVQITRRYAEFSAAIVGLNESFPSEGVNRLMAQLQSEVDNFLLRLAAEFPARKEQLIFLINNYDMMLNVLIVSLVFFLSNYCHYVKYYGYIVKWCGVEHTLCEHCFL